jgi:hypothetical protein
LLGEPLGGAQGAVGEGLAAVGAVDEFETLADAAENDRMIADDVASANREQRDFLLGALPDDPFAAVDADLIQVAVKPLGN